MGHLKKKKKNETTSMKGRKKYEEVRRDRGDGLFVKITWGQC